LSGFGLALISVPLFLFVYDSGNSLGVVILMGALGVAAAL
jgi:hypothetical protein